MAPAAETATLGIWTIARLAALCVLASETLFLWSRRRSANAPHVATSRIFWALTPALILAGLCVWCSVSVLQNAAPSQAPIAQLAR
jgi:hypothetical protein